MKYVATRKASTYQLIDEVRASVNQTCDSSRERSLALTKLDECEMWLDRCRPNESFYEENGKVGLSENLS